MVNYVVGAIVVLLGSWSYAKYRAFAKHLATAKASGLRYVVVPVFVMDPTWLLLARLVVPHLRRLPKSWTFPWLDTMYIDWYWDSQYAVFKELGTDTFLTVSPGGCALWTADADVTIQITTRRNDFPKPIHHYVSVDIYGKNVVSTEGQAWRLHRKITGPSFGEKNNKMVWQETIHQSQSMLTSWVGDGKTQKTITSVAADAMRLSLHIISRVGFGKPLFWPGVEDAQIKAEEAELAATGSTGSKPHSMTFTTALSTLLHYVLLVITVPHWILKRLPFDVTHRSYQSFVEWKQYLDELVHEKKAELAAGEAEADTDLLSALVSNLKSSTESGKQTGITYEEVLGNAFVFILAGHETAANSLHFAMLFLAINLPTQRALQVDIDQIVQGRPASEWDYEKDFPKHFGGMTGAVLAESLRLIPPVCAVPKSVTTGKSQPLNVDGKSCLVPAAALVYLCATSVHRNPRYWYTTTPADPAHPVHPTSNLDNDLEEFKPQRWILREKHDADKSSNRLAPDAFAPSSETADLGINTAADTAATLLRPPRGAYIPFSEGFRACIGRRFAQIEVIAALAVVFSEYSVELAVDDWASDEEVERMSTAERRVVWEKAKERAMRLMRVAMYSIITIQMRDGVVPLRLVKKGEERFAGF